MKNQLVVCLLAAIASPAFAGGSTDDFGTKALSVLKKHCFDCHAEGSNEGGFGFADDLKKLVAKERVIPGNVPQSRIFIRMHAGEMPPQGEEPTGERPTQEELDIIGQWIAAGAPEPGVDVNAVAPRQLIPLGAELHHARNYLRTIDRAERQYIRFFSVRVLYNTVGRTLEEIDYSRAALGKVLNSLSWRHRIVAPAKCDPDGTLYAVDIRDLTWTSETWTTLLSHYPYGLKYDVMPDDEVVNELARELYDLTETDIPILRADWFIARATRPPLYHHLLNVPEHDAQLEARLGVRALHNIRQAEVDRAGLISSGISEQHRLVERHEGTNGYYWKSYDFKPTSKRGDLTRFPLGPSFGNHPYPHMTFEHDGGEIIFRLPNGLQGYMLTDGEGRRINAGPTDVVADKTRVSGNVEIVNGVSCMACHTQGMLPVEDIVRDSSALGGEARNFMRRLYPKRAEMNQLIDEDRAFFRTAVLRAMKGMAENDAALVKADGSVLEPVGPLARFYAMQTLGIEELSAELGVEPEFLNAAVQLNDQLRNAGLGPLATGQGRMKRLLWEDTRHLISPFQKAASMLRLGTPKAIIR
jgi:serine/threonine-protein kinase